MSNKKSTKKQSVRLREKQLASGNLSLYLDIWYNGKRKYEFLKLHIVKPRNSFDRNLNKKTMQLAEDIRAKRQLEIQNSTFGFASDFKQDANFIEYFKTLIEKRKESKGNYGNWESALKHLVKYCGIQTTFREIDIKFVEGFKHYLQYDAKTKSGSLLSQNSQNSYFNKFRATLNAAFDDRLIQDNPAKRVKAIKPEETHREYLTIDELKNLVKTECKYPIMKRAFLFSCLTGMRWSDINKMIWSEVQKHNEGYRIVFRQKKTRGQEYLDISKQARDYLGEKSNVEERVFKGLKYSAWHNIELQRWIMRAGIAKVITFHCGRHTFAVIQLDMGTDIYTVSKLLGHSELKTTQIYAKIIDQKKREAVNKIPDINI
ncbi:MAG: site-specific integrase [Bacteroidales bacterium]|nr:site-specific integrase [Bacteroidales bacterium]